MRVGRLSLVVLAAASVLAPAPAAGSKHFIGVGSGDVVGSRHLTGSGHFVAPRTFFFRHPEPSVFPRVVDPWKFWPPPVVRKSVVVPARPFVLSFVVSTPVVSYAAPAAVYAPPAVAWAPAPAAVPTLATIPTPTVVEYDTGWSQLRGDGVTTPYVWVWIPKPPSPPVVTPEPPAPPPPAPPRPAPAADERERGPRLEAYHWTDEQGVTTWTNRLEKVPGRFQDEALRSIGPESEVNP